MIKLQGSITVWCDSSPLSVSSVLCLTLMRPLVILSQKSSSAWRKNLVDFHHYKYPNLQMTYVASIKQGE